MSSISVNPLREGGIASPPTGVFLAGPRHGESIRAEGIDGPCVVPCKYVMKFMRESTVLSDSGG